MSAGASPGLIARCVDGADRLLSRAGCKTWRVGADFLFERARCKSLAIILFSVVTIEWMLFMANLSRHAWGAISLAPWYFDCASDSEATNFYSMRSCGEPPIDGPVWELVINSLYFAVIQGLMHQCNNPWRSRCWALPTLVRGALNFYVYLMVSVDLICEIFELEPFRQPDQMSVIARQAVGDGWTGFMMALMVWKNWMLVVFLICRMVWFNVNQMKEDHEAAVRYTKLLLHGRKSFAERGRFHELCNILRAAVKEEDLTLCAVAVLREEQLAEDRRKAKAEAEVKAEAEASARESDAPHQTSSAACTGQDEVESDTPTRGSATAKEAKMKALIVKARRAMDSRPFLLRASATFTFFVLFVFVLGLVTMLVSANARVGVAARGARNTSASVAEGADYATGALDRVITMWNMASIGIVQMDAQVPLLQEVLAPLPAALQDANPEAAAQVEAALLMLSAWPSGAGIALESGANTTESLPFMHGRVKNASALAHKLDDIVDAHCKSVETFVSRFIVTTVSAAVFGACVSFGAVLYMLWSWPNVYKEVSTGAIKSNPTFKPQMCHPVTAPGLPGVMASCAAFAAILLSAAVVALVEMIAWFTWLLEVNKQAVKDFVVNLAIGAGAGVIIKTFLLDMFVGRKLLVSGDGYVLQWSAFAWYICCLMPLTFLDGVALAATRFVILLVMGAVSVARLDKTQFPPELAHLDRGYATYMSTLVMAHKHRNPIWRALCGKLIEDVASATEGTVQQVPPTVPLENPGETRPLTLSEEEMSRKRATQRWHFAVTMLNNPGLTLYRRRLAEPKKRRITAAGSVPASGDQSLPESTEMPTVPAALNTSLVCSI